jgi:hypothetical protein
MSRLYTPILKQKYKKISPPSRSCRTKIDLNIIAEESVQEEEPSFIFQTSEIDDYYQSAAKIADTIGLKNSREKKEGVNK